MKTTARHVPFYLVALVGLMTTGCGESLSHTELMATLQMESAPCTATFTQDHEVIDFWGDTLFTARTGETYILAGLYEWGTEIEAGLYYLDEEGAYRFDVEVEGSDVESFPFELSCTGSRTSMLGAFNDVTVYADEALTEEVCQLSKGASAPIESVSGHSLVSELFVKPAVYKVELAGFSVGCGGITEGYVEAPSASVLGTTTALVPLLRYAVPGN